MRYFSVKPASSIKGKITLSGDKSIAHRSIILSALSQGQTTVRNFPINKDCLFTIKAFKELGIKITQRNFNTGKYCCVVKVFGKGLFGLKKPKGPIFLGDSGTSFRLLLGVLAGQEFRVKLVAGRSLSRRPMLRVTAPLRMMGAQIQAVRAKHNSQSEEYPPITIKGTDLEPIDYKMQIASAQVKSAILLSALYAKGKTCIRETIRTRDHTERMLKLFKADIKTKQNKIFIKGNRQLISPKKIYIPADISSAAFFIVLATIIPDSEIMIKNVSLNSTRTGIIKVLRRMGADICIKASSAKIANSEPMGDIIVKGSNLKGARVKKQEIPSLIDELPILMVAACFAKGKTILEAADELRVKETDRIRSMTDNLTKMGANTFISKTGGQENIIIQGVKQLKGTKVRSFGDHRTAMSMAVAGLAAQGITRIDDVSCIDKSFPDFLNILNLLLGLNQKQGSLGQTLNLKTQS